MTEQNRTIPFLGGVIEQAKAGSFVAKDQQGNPEIDFQTQQPKMIEYPDRVIATHGRKKAVLDGVMVEALVNAWNDDPEFRVWCSQCK